MLLVPPQTVLKRFSPASPMRTFMPKLIGAFVSGKRYFSIDRSALVSAAMQERLEILEDVYLAEAQLAAGEGIPHEVAKATMLNGLFKQPPFGSP
jgi:hypothetical protein